MLSTSPIIQLTSIQQDLLERIENHYDAGKNSCLLFLPTGGGKTVVAADLIARWVSKGKRVLFCCHRTKLVDQTVDKLRRFYGIESAVIQGGQNINYKASVFVAMLQTLSNRQLPSNIDLVIFDEAHTTSYWDSAYSIMLHYSGGIFPLSSCKFLGLTGSPWRTKSDQGFCQFYDCLVVGPYLDELATAGEITPVRHFGWGGLIDYSKLTMAGGDYTQESLELVCDAIFNEKIVFEYKRRYSHLNSVVFCGTVKQATDIHARFNDAGLKTGLIVGTTSNRERDLIYEQYENGQLKVLVGVSVFTEGFDAPICNAAVLAYPTASLSKLYQMSGRPTRKYEGKTYAYLLDFCDNFSRLGFITEHHPISLCPTEKPPKTFETKLKLCPKCNLAVNRYVRVCECGYIYSKENNLVVEIKSKKRKPDYNNYGEILTSEQRRQVGYLRRKLHGIINKGGDPSLVVRVFFEQYRTIPPLEWFLGAVFDGDNSNSTMRAWYDYLKRVRPLGEQWWYNYWMAAEFGSSYLNFDGSDKWHLFFGCDTNSTWSEVFNLYRDWIVGKSENDVINANLMLEQAAFQLKQWDYVSTFVTNRARVSGLQMRMLQIASNVITAINNSDAVQLKKLVNQDLQLWQSSLKYLTDDERIQLKHLLKSYNNETDSVNPDAFLAQDETDSTENFSHTLKLQSKALVGSWCLLNNDKVCLIINVDSDSGHYLGTLGKEHVTFQLNNIKLIVNIGLGGDNLEAPIEISPSWRKFIVDYAPRVYKLLDNLYIFARFKKATGELELYVSSVIYKKFIRDLFEEGLLALIVSAFKNEDKLFFLNVRYLR